MNKCESTFDVMVQSEEGIGVVKQTLLDLARGQPEHANHKTTEHLKVSTDYESVMIQIRQPAGCIATHYSCERRNLSYCCF